jgi:bacterioferritin
MKKNNSEVINHLNIILRNELVAINQYFLHAKIMQDQGFNKLATLTKAESIDEMKHADTIIQRILFLKGMPKMTDYKNLNIGESVEEMLKNDYQLEIDAIADLKKAIEVAAKNQDTGSKDILEKILISEENHFDFLEIQIGLIKKIGIQNYLSSQL